MNSKPSKSQLLEYFRMYSQDFAQKKQLAKRMEELLETKIKHLKKKYRHLGATKAERKTFLDQEYKTYVSELLQWKELSLRALIFKELIEMKIRALY